MPRWLASYSRSPRQARKLFACARRCSTTYVTRCVISLYSDSLTDMNVLLRFRSLSPIIVGS